MTEIRTAIPDDIDRYLDSLVRTGPFASKAELVRAALMAFAGAAGPMPRGFDRENILAPDGRVYQLEYAREASMRGGPAVGVTYDGGIVLAALAPGSKLLRVSKIRRIGDSVAVVAAGLVADARQAIRHVQQSDPQTTEEVVNSFVDFLWQHTVDRLKRPLAAAFLIASALDGSPRLFYLDPSAALAEYDAAAIGEGEKDRTDALEQRYRRGKAEDAEALALEALGKPKAYEVVHVPG